MPNRLKTALLVGMGVLAGALLAWVVLGASRKSPPMASVASEKPPHRRILYWANPMNPSIHSAHPMKDNMGMAYTPVYAPSPQQGAPAKRRIKYWANPMNPSIHADHPMKDSMGMAYTPVYAAGPGAAARGVAVNGRLQQSLGVHLVPVRFRQMSHVIRTFGVLALDQNRVYSINPHFSGWAERLDVRAVGDPVRRGQVLAKIYSPALYSAEQEYLVARGERGLDGERKLEAAGAARLHLLGLSRADMQALQKQGRATRDFPVTAPTSGVVTSLRIHQGGYVSPQHNLMEIANLDRVWSNVAIYTSQLPWIHVGERVVLTLPAYPGRVWTGRVRFLYPTLNARSRTVTARLSFPAKGGILKPGMYAEASVQARARKELAVPASAVLRTQSGSYVMIGRPQGHFLPVQVDLGAESGGWIAVTRGLRVGETVVDNAQFLLYSESQFQSVQARMLPATRGAQNRTQNQLPSSPRTLAKPSGRPAAKPRSNANSMAGMVMGPGGHGHD